jgi:spore coat protein U-like protein
MKKLIALFAAIVLVSGLTTVRAQVTANASGSATIITPISITKTTDMNFGNVAVSASLGTVVLTPAGIRNPTGGVTLPAVTGTVAAAVFHVTGSGASTYAITLPTTYTINDGASHTMIINAFTSTPSVTGALTSGAQDIQVGATLNVAGAQVAGTYTNTLTPFPVTVNYN